MSEQRSDEARENFHFLSNEYAQALQALTAIENQASTLLLLGGSDDLRTFVDQFIDMASRTRAIAEETGETHFVEWFGELIRRAEALRTDIVPQ
ncbi:MAG TPA: hypothetical protein VFL80_01055 [Thermoanaerobaculia bacterium]|nr:hypothetical protein [Thermoanaerobaculia bacterium]